MSEQLITDDSAVVGEMAAPAIELEYGLGEVGHEPANDLPTNDLPANDLPANDLCCRRLGCTEWRAFDENTGKRWPYCQGNYCPNIGTGFGAQRRSISSALRRVANSPLFYSSPFTLRPGLPNQFVPPPVTNFKQVYRPFDSVSQPNMLAIEHELERSSDEDPMRRIQLLDEILKGTAPLNLITPHKEIHGFCNSIDDEELVWDMPVPASYGQRKCARHECRNAAYIWPKDITKFGSYCSSRCYWMEVETLNETRITALSADNIEYCRISDRFRSEIPSARIVQIFQLQMPRIIAQRYKTYRLCMAKKSNSSMASITHRMFHGTKSICWLLRLCVQGSGFCPDNCPMCGIAKTGNQKRYSRRAVKRMWFASTPAISYRYCADGPTKAMFVVDVVAPECGNIIVVDQDEATLPRFLVIFQ